MTSVLDVRLRRLAGASAAAVILGDGSTNDLCFVRSLSQRRIPVLHVVGARKPGSFSRYGMRVRMPPVEAQPLAWLDVVERTASVLPTPPVLFAVSDAHCAFVSRNAERLRRASRFLLPDEHVVARILDKRQQYAAAHAAGIPVPPTSYPESADDVRRLASAIDYPVILKPYTTSEGRSAMRNRKVVIVHSAEELIAAYARCTASGARFMVQTIVAGGEDALFSYSAFWDEHGREQAWYTDQKLRQFPLGFGAGALKRTVDVPVVLRQSRHLLEALRYRGLVHVEFKRDVREDTYALMEINPRTAGGVQLGVRAGVDLPWIAYRHLAGLPPDGSPERSFRRNVSYVNEELDVQAFWGLRRSKALTLRAWLRSWRRTHAWALFAWDDPLPLLACVWRFLSLGTRRALSRRRSPPP